jgi:hypothetical protein
VASVIDGDTIEIHGQKIGLHGIDAPESGQTGLDDASQKRRYGQGAMSIATNGFVGCCRAALEVNVWLAQGPWSWHVASTRKPSVSAEQAACRAVARTRSQLARIGGGSMDERAERCWWCPSPTGDTVPAVSARNECWLE